MKINTHNDCFEYVTIENFYTRYELQDIWKEIDFLSDNLLSPERTGSARDETGKPLKKNKGVFLDEIYRDRSISNILKYNRKLWTADILGEPIKEKILNNLSHWWRMLWLSDLDTTLLNCYGNDGHYKPHSDSSVFTATTVLYREPENFTGGDFYFSEYDITIPKENNMMIIFPGYIKHEVTQVSMIDEKLKNTERYSITQFVNYIGRPT